MAEKIIDLAIGKSTVGSVISRLARYEDEIEHISCVVTWKKDKSTSVCGDSKPTMNWCYDAMRLDGEVQNIMAGTVGEPA